MICETVKKNNPGHSIESEQRGHTVQTLDTGRLVGVFGEGRLGGALITASPCSEELEVRSPAETEEGPQMFEGKDKV